MRKPIWLDEEYEAGEIREVVGDEVDDSWPGDCSRLTWLLGGAEIGATDDADTDGEVEAEEDADTGAGEGSNWIMAPPFSAALFAAFLAAALLARLAVACVSSRWRMSKSERYPLQWRRDLVH